MTDVREKIAKLDEELIQLLADRVALCLEAQEEDPDILGADVHADALAQWDEAADEHGWNPAVVTKICKGVIELSKTAE